MEKETISSFALREARKCARAYDLGRLRLNYHGGGQSASGVVRTALEAVKSAFASGLTVTKALEDAEKALSDYPVAEDDLASAAEQTRRKVLERIRTMAEYLWEQEGSRRINEPLEFETESYRFRDLADIVLEKDGVRRAIKFDQGESPYSSKARKTENRPETAPEIAFMCGAGYPSGEIWYLRSKDEKADCVPAFERKPEKNIVRASILPEAARGYLHALMKSRTENQSECRNCRHASVCHLEAVRTENTDEGIVTGKEPVFTEAQKRAVNHRDGAMALLAVPGAGKTTVLVHRLLKLLKDGVPASEILFVTFTKKAAGEIRDRVAALLGDDAEIPAVFTFNAFGYTLLKENPMLVGNRVKISDENDIKGMVRAILDVFSERGRVLKGMSYSGAFLEYGIIGRVTAWFKEISEDGWDTFMERCGKRVTDPDTLKDMYTEYDRLFREKGFISFEEQVTLVNEIFRKHPKVAKDCAERFRYIMVDEFQDASAPQAEMIYTIAGYHGNLVVVGDEDQSIYSWRGGSSRFLLEFKKDFPKAQVIVMSDNFRSNDKILAAADCIIHSNTERVEKQLRGHKSASYPPVFYQRVGVEKIAEAVPKLLKAYKPGEIAILARTNKRLEEVEEGLRDVVRMSTPKDYIINDEVFRMVSDVLTLYYNACDDVALYRCLCRLGVTDFPEKSFSTDSLCTAVQRMEPAFSLEHADIHALEGYAGADSAYAMAGKKLLTALKKLPYCKSMENVFGAVSELFGVPADHKVFLNLLDMCDEHAIVKLSELYACMRDMVLYKSTKRVGYGVAEDAVSLLTTHDAKGQEFPVVFIYSVEDFASGEEEDNCLLYVAMTRAKNTLIMTEGETGKSMLGIGNVAEYLNIL